MRVAIVERELVAGEWSYWACMPTKSLLRPGEALAFRDWAHRRWDDSGQVSWLDGKGST